MVPKALSLFLLLLLLLLRMVVAVVVDVTATLSMMYVSITQMRHFGSYFAMLVEAIMTKTTATTQPWESILRLPVRTWILLMDVGETK
jgi:hypothetical protein